MAQFLLTLLNHPVLFVICIISSLVYVEMTYDFISRLFKAHGSKDDEVANGDSGFRTKPPEPPFEGSLVDRNGYPDDGDDGLLQHGIDDEKENGNMRYVLSSSDGSSYDGSSSDDGYGISHS